MSPPRPVTGPVRLATAPKLMQVFALDVSE